MARADGKLFELLADEPSRDLLWALLREEEPQTQRQLAAILHYNSSTISRRMSVLEAYGLVLRQTRRAPYEVLFRAETRALLLAAARLAKVAKQRQADDASEYERDLLKESLDGGWLRDRSAGA